jgi:hypothetical protein
VLRAPSISIRKPKGAHSTSYASCHAHGDLPITKFSLSGMILVTAMLSLKPVRSVLGGGRPKRRIVGCILLRMHHYPATNKSLGDKLRDGAFQEGNAPYARSALLDLDIGGHCTDFAGVVALTYSTFDNIQKCGCV